MGENSGKNIGEAGEAAALKFLKDDGYKILARNFEKVFSPVLKGEIDIIAKKDKFIIFVEVKTAEDKNSNANFFPEDRVNWKKQKKIKMISQAWLNKNKIPLDSPVRFDIISVLVDLKTGNAKISHFENAF